LVVDENTSMYAFVRTLCPEGLLHTCINRMLQLLVYDTSMYACVREHLMPEGLLHTCINRMLY
jgi:hypothetical protein